MSVWSCSHPFHPLPCLGVQVPGGRKYGYHLFRHGEGFRVCPAMPTSFLGVTMADDPATSAEVALVMAAVAADPCGQEWLAQFMPRPLPEENDHASNQT